jgi:hypothetical protein
MTVSDLFGAIARFPEAVCGHQHACHEMSPTIAAILLPLKYARLVILLILLPVAKIWCASRYLYRLYPSYKRKPYLFFTFE